MRAFSIRCRSLTLTRFAIAEFIEAPFLRRHLDVPTEQKPRPPPLPAAVVFEVGTNVWRRYEQWPPAEAKPLSLYLHPDGKLSREQPEEGGDEYAEWVSDPAKPVPYTSDIAIGMTRAHVSPDSTIRHRNSPPLFGQTVAAGR